MAYKILVVDDEAHYADMLRDLLLQNNFIADMAVSVQQALDSLDTEDYALIIADYKMPGMDGAEFLQRVRLRNATIPFFMVSGLMNTHELIRVANLGATLVFEKPLEIGNFVESVKRYVAPLSDSEFQKRFRGDVSGENYPSELVHLSDKSHLGREFVQKLWLAFQRERIAVVELLPGAELELIAKEVSHWKGRTNSQFYTLSPEDFANPGCVDALNGIVRDPETSPVVIIQNMDTATEEEMNAAAEFFNDGHFATKLHSEIFLLLVLEKGAWAERVSRAHPGLAKILLARRLPLAPLRERPSDIARYARRLLSTNAQTLGTPEKAAISSNAVGLLLQHRWAGEYDELSTKIEQAVTLERPSPLRAEEFALVLEGENSHPSGGYTLQRRLLIAQTAAVADSLERSSGDMALALARMGVAPDTPTTPSPDTLIFPGLLQ